MIYSCNLTAYVVDRECGTGLVGKQEVHTLQVVRAPVLEEAMQFAKYLRRLGFRPGSLPRDQQDWLGAQVPLWSLGPQRTFKPVPNGPSLQDFLRPTDSPPAVLVRLPHSLVPTNHEVSRLFTIALFAGVM